MRWRMKLGRFLACLLAVCAMVGLFPAAAFAADGAAADGNADSIIMADDDGLSADRISGSIAVDKDGVMERNGGATAFWNGDGSLMVELTAPENAASYDGAADGRHRDAGYRNQKV